MAIEAEGFNVSAKLVSSPFVAFVDMCVSVSNITSFAHQILQVLKEGKEYLCGAGVWERGTVKKPYVISTAAWR